MENYSGQVIHVLKTPKWVIVMYCLLLPTIAYALFVNITQWVDLWKANSLNRIFIVLAIGLLLFFTIAIFRFRSVLTSEAIYLRNWRGSKEVPFGDVTELYHFKNGSIFFVLKNFSKIEFWVPPSKLNEVVDAATRVGCSVINGDH